MKKIIISLLIAVLFVPAAYADRVVLNSTESLSTPTAAKMDWFIDNITPSAQVLRVKYRWLDASDGPIQLSGASSAWRTWECRNRAAQLAADCTAAGEPYAGCTGAGTGENLDPGDACFTDVFGFSIRSQDVGTTLGAGLRTLLWNQFRLDVLSTGNNGTFE
jgi:hypothetical protein